MALAQLFPIADRRPSSEWAWLVLLIAAAALSSVTFECVAPFAAFALLAAATMSWPGALGAVAVVWLVNQALGFGVLGYLFDAMTLIWGGVIGSAALAATLAAVAVLSRLQAPLVPRLAAAFAAALIVDQALLALAATVLGGLGNFTAGIVARVAVSDLAWVLGIAILRFGLQRLDVLRGVGRPVTT